MQFTLSALREHIDTAATLEQIAATLDAIGITVARAVDPAAALQGFVVGHVVAAAKHPDADKLQCLIVDTGTEQLKVVCGAPNAREGMKGIFAPAGSYIPGLNVTLKKSMIRGQESNGMMCSEAELQISDEHQGIIALPATAVTGSAAATALNMDDPLIVLDAAALRPDLAAVHHIAQELAAAGLGTLKNPSSGAFASITVAYTPDTATRTGGFTIDPDRQKNILVTLGYNVDDSNATWHVTPPAGRDDLATPVHIAADIIRIFGYKHIPSHIPVAAAGTIDASVMRIIRTRRTLAARGMTETTGAHTLQALTEIPQTGDVAFFATGTVVTGLRRGLYAPHHWASPARDVDVFDAKADAIAALESMGVNPAQLQTAAPAAGIYDPAQSGVFKMGKMTVAAFGAIDPAKTDGTAAAGFEIFTEALPQPRKKAATARPAFQSAGDSRTAVFSLTADPAVSAEKIIRAIRGADKKRIGDIHVTGLLHESDGRKTVEITVTLSGEDTATLTTTIVDHVQKQTGAVLSA